MRIEDKISSMRRDPTYLKIKQNLRHLEARRFGRGSVYVASPDNLEETLELKNRSPEIREATSRYKEMRDDFNVQINDLYLEKMRLREQLFART